MIGWTHVRDTKWLQPLVNGSGRASLAGKIGKIYLFQHSCTYHPELSGCITTLIVRNMEAANFGAAMDNLIDQDAYIWVYILVCFIGEELPV